MFHYISNFNREETMSYYIDITECDFGDGRVFIHRTNQSKKGNWYVRIKRTTGTTRYYRKSLKTTNKTFALREAYKVWLKLIVAEEMDIPFGKTKFRELWGEFMRTGVKGSTTPKSLGGKYRLYYEPFFGDFDIYRINDALWNQYLIWRMEYWKIREANGEAQRLKEQRIITIYNKDPSLKTLEMERKQIMQFLIWCETKNYLHKTPRIKATQEHKCMNAELLQRISKKHYNGAITRQRLDLIRIYLRRWAFSEGEFYIPATKATAKKNNTNRVKYRHNNDPNKVLSRYRLWYYFQISYHFLLRATTEMNTIRWKDVYLQKSKKHDGLYIAVINHSMGKVKRNRTGRERIAVSTYEGAKFLMEWKVLSKEKLGLKCNPDDYIFPNWDGSYCKTSNIGYLFRKRLEEWGLRYFEGVSTTLYSVRHARITQLITDGKDRGTISTMADTSIQMISQTYFKQFILKGRIDTFSNQYPEGEVPREPNSSLYEGDMKDLAKRTGLRIDK